MTDRADERIATHYRATAARLAALLDGLDADDWARAVPACPGWSVRDVLAHLLAVAEDALAGRLAGPPDEAATAEQVRRHAAADPAALLAGWRDLVDPFSEGAALLGAWPAVFDVVSHEHDVRGALDRPGARDGDTVALAAELLVRALRAPRPVVVHLGAGQVSSRGDGPPLELRADAFEVLRFRLGRRSIEQVRALDWSEPPDDVLGSLFVFGPREEPLHE